MPNFVTNQIEFEASPQEMDKILHAIRRDGDVLGSFDFNKLIPMPNSLDITDGSIKYDAVNAFVSNLKDNLSRHSLNPDIPFDQARQYIETGEQILKGFFFTIPFDPMTEKDIIHAAKKYDMDIPAFLSLGKQYLDNQLVHGASTWYEWCTHNWGTKWNTIEGNLLSEGNTLRFDTAWSAPLPILKALSKAFPTIPIQHTWADEDIGQNVGQLTFLNGSIYSAHVPEPGSADAYEMAFEIHQIEPEEMCLRFDVKEGTYIYDKSMMENREQKSDSLDNTLDLAKEKARKQSSPGNEPEYKDHPER